MSNPNRATRLFLPILLLFAAPATAHAEKGDIMLSISSGTGAFVSIVNTDAAPKLFDHGRFPAALGLNTAYEVGNEWGFSVDEGILLEKGTAYFLRPGMIFYTHREYLSTFTRFGPSFFLKPTYYGGDLGFGGILRFHRNVEAVGQVDFMSLFAGKGLSGKGAILSTSFSLGLEVRI